MSAKSEAARLKFLHCLERNGGFATRKLLPLTDRSGDRVRQSLKRDGYVEWGCPFGAKVSGWSLTKKGRQFLAKLESGASTT